jgi:hypothetical protein
MTTSEVQAVAAVLAGALARQAQAAGLGALHLAYSSPLLALDHQIFLRFQHSLLTPLPVDMGAAGEEVVMVVQVVMAAWVVLQV